jgi:hypothetical protein
MCLDIYLLGLPKSGVIVFAYDKLWQKTVAFKLYSSTKETIKRNIGWSESCRVLEIISNISKPELYHYKINYNKHM